MYGHPEQIYKIVKTLKYVVIMSIITIIIDNFVKACRSFKNYIRLVS